MSKSLLSPSLHAKANCRQELYFSFQNFSDETDPIPPPALVCDFLLFFLHFLACQTPHLVQVHVLISFSLWVFCSEQNPSRNWSECELDRLVSLQFSSISLHFLSSQTPASWFGFEIWLHLKHGYWRVSEAHQDIRVSKLQAKPFHLRLHFLCCRKVIFL